MNVLFVHQNFPGQFKFLAPALARRGHRVVALSMRQQGGGAGNGVRIIGYWPTRSIAPSLHPWLRDLETKVVRAEACLRRAMQLKAEGYTPDVIIAHPGWGESMFLKDLWPRARLGIYCEYFYQATGGDVGFDSEFPSDALDTACRLRIKNLNNHLHFDVADAGLSPTHWQASTFPEPFRRKITVAHDGIETTALAPEPTASFALADGRFLNRNNEVITFVSRNLEPYRGYHIFMRSLPQILASRPAAIVLIVGGDGVSYGPKPSGDRSWMRVFADEVRESMPTACWDRIHFLGKLPFQDYVSVLRISSVHVYLTYPFVLSWSLLEAMSLECAIVASDTPPVREALVDRETGRLVDFFDVDGFVDTICRLLDDRQERTRLGKAAREVAVSRYDLATSCLPQQLAWVNSLHDDRA